ncbi:hypothetical protein [Neorhizobium alkalisoli]|jgi:ABC-type Na+ efflux pump permease subunit|uniref:Uncharacterized protein n=1 Tax=Neorhizobium alkalisoli TaxID=528178 RepID=A0A561Q0W8_9HYPH|nr:hypothetical protein [Neorhizobium alkalisoli]TWF43965.1 hypothetical protein FHW37_11753 [Neorhizobium alkalisoli]
MTDNNPIGVSPQRDRPSEKRKRAQMGKGFVIALACFAIIMFAIYFAIAGFGIAKA